MLRQEELEFIKAMSNIKLSPIFIQKLGKALAVFMKRPFRSPRLTLRSLRSSSVRAESGVRLWPSATVPSSP